MNRPIVFSLSLLSLISSCGGPTGGNISASSTGPLRIFVTQNLYNGNLGGKSGADTKCMNDPNTPPTGTFKALISTSSSRRACNLADCTTTSVGRVDWPLRADTTYYRLDQTTVIGTTTTNAVFGFNLSAPIDDTYAEIWTGLSHEFAYDSTYNCLDWTDGSSGPAGRLGISDAVSGDAVADTTSNCDEQVPIYCVEQ